VLKETRDIHHSVRSGAAHNVEPTAVGDPRLPGMPLLSYQMLYCTSTILRVLNPQRLGLYVYYSQTPQDWPLLPQRRSPLPP
jgi:hypothetical protein